MYMLVDVNLAVAILHILALTIVFNLGSHIQGLRTLTCPQPAISNLGWFD